MKILSEVLKPPKNHRHKKSCAIFPYSPVLLSVQALSDLEILLKCFMCRFSEEMADEASMGDWLLLYTIQYRLATEGREN